MANGLLEVGLFLIKWVTLPILVLGITVVLAIGIVEIVKQVMIEFDEKKEG